ncbi:MAG: AAA family ATPase, partial [Actinomycetota bacterium]|nr:AAA family ATPase [Actinomycetota bacterium]
MTVLREQWVRRVHEAWEHRSIVWLHGVRRVGKTTLARSIEGAEYFDCDLLSVRNQLSDPEGILRSLRGRRVVFDEVQMLENPAGFLKTAADHFPDVKVVATGSSTLAATAKFSDSLTGRKREVWLTPMCHADLGAFAGDITDRLWRGGLPPFFLGDSVDADTSEWMQSYWARDVQELFRIERRWSFVRFIELMLAASGGMFEATRFAAQCEVS